MNMFSAVAVILSPSMTTDGGSNGNLKATRPPSYVTGVLFVWGVWLYRSTAPPTLQPTSASIRDLVDAFPSRSSSSVYLSVWWMNLCRFWRGHSDNRRACGRDQPPTTLVSASYRPAAACDP